MNPTSTTSGESGVRAHPASRPELLRSASSRIRETVTRYKAVTEHLYCDLNGEAVVLSLANGRYYGMNSVGVRIWELLQDPRSAEEIERAILIEYEVEPRICRQQVSEFLQAMIAEELLVVIDESAPEIP